MKRKKSAEKKKKRKKKRKITAPETENVIKTPEIENDTNLVEAENCKVDLSGSSINKSEMCAKQTCSEEDIDKLDKEDICKKKTEQKEEIEPTKAVALSGAQLDLSLKKDLNEDKYLFEITKAIT